MLKSYLHLLQQCHNSEEGAQPKFSEEMDG